jgi:hypothetical protein
VQPRPASLHRSTLRIALIVVGVVIVLSVADLTSDRFNKFIQDHSLISTFITEAVLLVGAYLVIDEIIQRRETRRWSDVTFLGTRALSTRAEGPAEVIQRTVDRLPVETSGSVDYQEFVSERASELGAWLRADEARAREFAEDMRQSASRLEEAIILWGPTLVEDPESAELINLLPDIVDSARSAADAIAPAASWFDRAVGRDETVGVARGSTDEDRRLFEDSLLVVLKERRRVRPATVSWNAAVTGGTQRRVSQAAGLSAPNRLKPEWSSCTTTGAFPSNAALLRIWSSAASLASP